MAEPAVEWPHRSVAGAPMEVPLQLALFGARDVPLMPQDAQLLKQCDLVVALGNVDLDHLGRFLDPETPALCVAGDRDRYGTGSLIPAPFHLLSGSGVWFRGWRIVGLSGAPSEGHTTTVSAVGEPALETLSNAGRADILLSHAPPAGFEPEIGDTIGDHALTAYIDGHGPMYHFHANECGESSVIYRNTLIVGVDGALVPPPLDLS